MWIWFFLFPIAEFIVAVRFSAKFGFLTFAGALFVAAFLGFICLRAVGRPDLNSNNVATRTLVLFLAGLLFLFPGLVSDALAVLLLIPPVRKLLFYLLISPLKARGGFVVYQSTGPIRDVTPPKDVTPSHADQNSLDSRRDPR